MCIRKYYSFYTEKESRHAFLAISVHLLPPFYMFATEENGEREPSLGTEVMGDRETDSDVLPSIPHGFARDSASCAF